MYDDTTIRGQRVNVDNMSGHSAAPANVTSIVYIAQPNLGHLWQQPRSIAQAKQLGHPRQRSHDCPVNGQFPCKQLEGPVKDSVMRTIRPV